MAEELKQISGIDILVSEKVREIESKKTEVESEYAPLVSIATTQDNLKERKKDKASITKKKKEIDDERIAFEKKWKAAIAPITDAYKAVTIILAGYENEMKETLDAFETQRILAKQQAIKDIFGSIPTEPEIAGWITLESIYNPKWENATCTEKEIREAIESTYAMLKVSYDNITGMKHPYEEEGLKVLRETRDFGLAVAKMNDLAEQQRIIEARKQAEEAEKERLEEEVKNINSKFEPVPLPFDGAEFKAEPLPFGAPTLTPVYTVKCTVRTTVELELIKHSLDNLGISYEVRKEMVEE